MRDREFYCPKKLMKRIPTSESCYIALTIRTTTNIAKSLNIVRLQHGKYHVSIVTVNCRTETTKKMTTLQKLVDILTVENN